MKRIVKRRTKEVLTEARADGVGVNGDNDANATGADEVVGLMIRGMSRDTMRGTMPKESAMGNFLSL